MLKQKTPEYFLTVTTRETTEEINASSVFTLQRLTEADHRRFARRYGGRAADYAPFKTRIVFAGDSKPMPVKETVEEIKAQSSMQGVDFIEARTGRFILGPAIVTIEPVGADDHQKMIAKYPDRDPTEITSLNTRFEFVASRFPTTTRPKNFPVKIEDLKEMGIKLLDTGNKRFVLAKNVEAVTPFTKDLAAKLTAVGKDVLQQNWRSSVQLNTTTVLSLVPANQIEARRAKALGQGTDAAVDAPEAPAV